MCVGGFNLCQSVSHHGKVSVLLECEKEGKDLDGLVSAGEAGDSMRTWRGRGARSTFECIGERAGHVSPHVGRRDHPIHPGHPV